MRPGRYAGRQGLFPAELDAWKRDAIAGLGEPLYEIEDEIRGQPAEVRRRDVPAFPGVPIVVHADHLRPEQSQGACRTGRNGAHADLGLRTPLKAYRATALTTRPICRMYDKY